MSMDENDKKHFHRFVKYLLERFDNDADRSDFESMVLVLHHFFQKEHEGITLDLSVNQLLCYNGFNIDIPHFGESASLKTLSWIQRRFFEDVFGLLVFSFGADINGKMDLKSEDITRAKDAFYYDQSKIFKDHRCTVRLSSRKVKLMDREFFMTSLWLALKS